MATRKTETPSDPEPSDDGGGDDDAAEAFAQEWQDIKDSILELGRQFTDHLGQHHDEQHSATASTAVEAESENAPRHRASRAQEQASAGRSRGGAASKESGDRSGRDTKPREGHPYFRKLWGG